MNVYRRVGRELGAFELAGNHYRIAYSHHGINAFVYLDDLENGPEAAKVLRPESPDRRVVLAERWCGKSSVWQRAFRREVARICRADAHGSDPDALSAAGEFR